MAARLVQHGKAKAFKEKYLEAVLEPFSLVCLAIFDPALGGTELASLKL
jgi:hypothetical protein